MIFWGLSCALPAQENAPQPIVLGQSYQLASRVLGQTRRVNVYLPPGYNKSGRRYPVLYLLDGGVQEDFFHIAGVATLAADFRRLREFIVVGIEGIDRYHDLLPPSAVEAEQKRFPTTGGAAAFREFISSELLPFVAEQLRVTDETVLMGESAGGLFVVETFLRQPALFHGYVAVSPSLQWDGQSIAKAAAEVLRSPSFPAGRRLYLSIADEGGGTQEGVERVVAALKETDPGKVEWTYTPMPQETHGTTFHPVALAAVRKFFAEAPEKR